MVPVAALSTDPSESSCLCFLCILSLSLSASVRAEIPFASDLDTPDLCGVLCVLCSAPIFQAATLEVVANVCQCRANSPRENDSAQNPNPTPTHVPSFVLSLAACSKSEIPPSLWPCYLIQSPIGLVQTRHCSPHVKPEHDHCVASSLTVAPGYLGF